MDETRVKIKIDGTVYDADRSKNLLQTCLSLGFDIPHFCFHPAMGSVGACRLCAVKKFNGADDVRGRIVMSCMEPVTEGLIISTCDKEIKAFRAAVIESLMTNHPHDCPVCDEGGECHLQDMTVMTGHNYRRFIFKKRTHLNQYLGPFINHEMNRCIQCYRCVRFYRDYAGGTDFAVSGSAGRVYFGRHKDGILENEFSGNLIEVCPTGVFTDKTLKNHYSRKWDLSNAPSVCVHCSLGCNIIAGERYGTVRRILTRYNGAVNGHFLCDRGRFGYEFLNSPDRIRNIMVKKLSENSEEEAPESAKSILKSLLNGKKLAGIGSPRASLESNFALEVLVGKENFFHGISENEFQLTRTAIEILRSNYIHTSSLRETEKADAILILGEDITNTAPMLSLSVRQAMRNKSLRLAEKSGIPVWNDAPLRELAQQTRTPLFIATPYSTKMDNLAENVYYSTPGNIARLGNEVAHLIDSSAPQTVDHDDEIKKTARIIAGTLINTENPVIITGFQHKSEAVLKASANIAYALKNKGIKGSLSIVFPESDSLGLGLLDGKSVETIYNEKDDKVADTLIILENDLYSRFEIEKTGQILSRFKNIIVLDHLINSTVRQADVALPAGTFTESTGSIVNNEGRIQRYYRVLPHSGQTDDSWRQIDEMIGDVGEENNLPWKNHDDLIDALILSYPVFSPIKDCVPDSGFRIFNEKIARQTLRYSGRTAINAGIAVSEPMPPSDNDSPFNFSMEGFKGITPGGLTPYYWSPGWNSVQALYKYTIRPDDNKSCAGQGVLIFDGQNGKNPGYYRYPSEILKNLNGTLELIPVHRIFGSEELSSKGEALSERIPEPFIVLNRNEIARLNTSEDAVIRLSVNDTLIDAVVKADNNMADGTAGLFIRTGRMPYVELPAVISIRRSEQKTD